MAENFGPRIGGCKSQTDFVSICWGQKLILLAGLAGDTSQQGHHARQSQHLTLPTSSQLRRDPIWDRALLGNQLQNNKCGAKAPPSWLCDWLIWPDQLWILCHITQLDTNKIDWIQDLSKTCEIDLLQLQEHFKATKSIETFFKKHFENNFDSYVIPAYREPFQDSGRAKGGLAQLSSKYLKIKKERIKTKSWRLQAQILHIDQYKIIWFNCYMPTDPQTIIYEEVELLPILDEIDKILDNNLFDDCVLGGDLNFDQRRGSGFAACLRDFLDRIGLKSVWGKVSTWLHTSAYRLEKFLYHWPFLC